VNSSCRLELACPSWARLALSCGPRRVDRRRRSTQRGRVRRFLARDRWTNFVASEPWPFLSEPYFAFDLVVSLTFNHSRQAFQLLPSEEQDDVIEFLKTLQVLPPETHSLVIDENGKPKAWPPRSH